MSSAATIAAALNGKREGRNWRCRCPLHGGRSLIVSDGEHRLLVKCWGGCDSLDVLAEFRRMGMVNAYSAPDQVDHRADEDRRRCEYALRIWNCSWHGGGSPASIYLASRGL